MKKMKKTNIPEPSCGVVMKPNPFNPKAPHHLYIGLFMLFLAYTMWGYDYYHPLAEITATIGAFVTIDDVIEHTVTAKTPLRLFFEKVLYTCLKKLKLVK